MKVLCYSCCFFHRFPYRVSIDSNKDKVHGRPTGVVVHPDGLLLLTDDKTNTVWRIPLNKVSVYF